jgi:hypothetical protein
MPVIASYGDALGIRAFAERRDLAARPGRPEFAMALAVRQAADQHGVGDQPPLPGARRLEDHGRLGIPRQGGKFVLSWAYHPRALPLAVPAATLHMAAQRGMDVTVLRPEGFELPEAMMAKARRRRGQRRRLCARPGPPRGAGRRPGALCQGVVSTRHYGDRRCRCEKLRRELQDWTVDESWFETGRADCRFMHCLPVRRNVAVADRILDGPRSVVLQEAHNRMVGRWPCSPHAGGAEPPPGTDTRKQTHENQPGPRHRRQRAQARRALHPHVQGQGVRAEGRRRGVRRRPSTHALMEQVAILHQVGIRVVLVHGGGPQSTELPARSGVEPRMVEGSAGHRRQTLDVTTMVLNGLINTRILAACRDLGAEAGRHLRRRRRADPRRTAARR